MTLYIPTCRFCFSGNNISPKALNSQCRLDPNLTLADCTYWSPTSLSNGMTTTGTTYIVVDQILPDIDAISGACVESVINGLDSLYYDANGDLNPPPASRDCTTNCVLSVRNDKTCETSMLLLEQVYRQEARDFLNSMRIGTLDSCVIGLDCCGDLSQAIPTICSEQREYYRLAI